jgi:protein gp37
VAESAIEWTDATWNPVTGCDRISPGCDNCYALTLAARLKRMGQPRYQRDGDPRTSGPGFGVTLHWDKLAEPASWRRPRMVFVNSMSDLFHKDVPDEFIRRVFLTMGTCREHTFQVLTKRPKRMRRFMEKCYPETVALDYDDAGRPVVVPLPNVWLGTSIESRTYVDRADHLRATPAAVRFISAEPLLGPLLPNLIDYSGHRHLERYDCAEPGCDLDALYVFDDQPVCDDHATEASLDLDGIDWLIVGGESGQGHRPMDAEWVRDLRDAAQASGTAFFFKQWGGRTPKAGGRELDGRTWDEMPTREAVRA